jgi:hypothetical protein
METTSFPPEMRRLAALEARLGDDLSLKDIEKIEEKIAKATTDTTQEVAIRLFERFESKKPSLIQRALVKVEKASGPAARVRLLTPLIPYLDPDVVDRKLNAIALEASLSNGKTQRVVQNQLESLHFAQQNPVVQDLFEFKKRAREISTAIRNTNSLDGLRAFNPRQIGEITRFSGRVV